MGQVPKLNRLDRRIQRSKRSGKIVLGGVLVLAVVFGVALIQGLFLALDAGRNDLVTRALVGIGFLLGLALFSGILIRRQHRLLDEAREEMGALVKGEPPD